MSMTEEALAGASFFTVSILVPSDGMAAQSAATARQIWRRLQAGPDRAGTAAAAELLRPTDVSSLQRAGSRNDFRRTPQTPTQHLAAADAAGCALPVRRILAYVKIKCTPAAILTTLYRATRTRSSPSAEKERPGKGEALFFCYAHCAHPDTQASCV